MSSAISSRVRPPIQEPFSITNGHTTGDLPLGHHPPIRAIGHDHNIDQRLITVTEDKALICFTRNIRQLGKKRWIHPLSLLASLSMALATSEFDKLSWVDPALLKALFIVMACGTAGWLAWEIVQTDKAKDVAQAIDDIFHELRGGQVPSTEPHSFMLWRNR